MLSITVPAKEFFIEETEAFVHSPATTLKLEHSLLSISKWEQKWHTPYLNRNHTSEENLDYIKCMTINNVDPMVYAALTPENTKEIMEYIEDVHTARVFNNRGTQASGAPMTSEDIYCLMFNFGIPLEFEKRHFGSLYALLRVCSDRQNGGDKMSKTETIDYQRRLNEINKAKLKTRG